MQGDADNNDAVGTVCQTVNHNDPLKANDKWRGLRARETKKFAVSLVHHKFKFDQKHSQRQTTFNLKAFKELVVVVVSSAATAVVVVVVVFVVFVC